MVFHGIDSCSDTAFNGGQEEADRGPQRSREKTPGQMSVALDDDGSSEAAIQCDVLRHYIFFQGKPCFIFFSIMFSSFYCSLKRLKRKFAYSPTVDGCFFYLLRYGFSKAFLFPQLSSI